MGKPANRKESVELAVYQHASKEILIDSFTAKEWSEFVIVKISGTTRPEDIDVLSNSLSNWATAHNKMVVLVPDNIDIDFYGVEVYGR